MTKRWICCQIGAREHYAVPRALHQSGRLAGLYTDFWASQRIRSMIGDIPFKGLQSLSARFHPKLHDAPVSSWNWRSLGWEAGRRYCWRREECSGNYPGYIQVGRRFATQVCKALKRGPKLGSGSVFFAYTTGALEAMELCGEHGTPCVLNQIDPNRVEIEMVCEEEKRWAGWATRQIEIPEKYFRRREQEWALARRVVVNSEFCRQAIVKQGVPPEKLVVVPLCYEPASRLSLPKPRDPILGPLRVLWLGQVVLRKGIQYVLQAARYFESRTVRFDIVGPIGISRDAVASAPPNVVFHGRVTRDQAAKWYRSADVFALPTLSDGFAITQLEAMAHGLPVIATPCCGEVVNHGLDGFVVPPRDAESLAKTLQRYLDEPGLLRDQQRSALVKAGQFTLERLAANLLSLEAALDET
jgi:hypothetical protein